MRIWIDFESFSELDITEVGPVVYAHHPSTQIICMSWRTQTEHGFWVSEDFPFCKPDENGIKPWIPLRQLFNKPSIDRLSKLLAEPNVTVEAHNAMFEKCLWQYHGHFFNDWPVIPFEKWRCSASKAAACALPRNLGDAGRALHLKVVKDEETGSRLLRRLTRPPDAKTLKKQNGWAFPVATKEEWEQFFSYCDHDTLAEMELSNALPELSPKELEVWRMDQRMNFRAIPVDVPGAKKAIAIADTWTDELNAELSALTVNEAGEPQVTKATQRERLLKWLATQGVYPPDMTAVTLDVLLPTMTEGKAKRAVEIKRSIGRSSTAKYQTLVDTSHGGRLHDTQLYHGSTTGRWTGKRFQPHNLPRGAIKDMDFAWKVINEDDVEMIRLLFGDPMEFLSHALRGAIVADPGELLHCGDYSAVETRVLFWVAQETVGLDVFRKGEDIYLDMASDIYGRKITAADVEADKQWDMARQLGKQAILGLGFNMSYPKFLITCRGYKLKFSIALIRSIVPEADIIRLKTWIENNDWDRCRNMGFTIADLPELVLMKFVMDRYRARYKNTVVKLWKDVEDAAKQAVRNPGKMFVAGRTGWVVEKIAGRDFLTAHLPSRRKLYYPDIELDGDIDGLSYMGIDGKTHQWVREKTYGGKLVENIVQATARDLMAEGMLRVDKPGSGFLLFMAVHDEIVAQAKRRDVERFNALISEVPEWAYGLPLAAKSWAGVRYKK